MKTRKERLFQIIKVIFPMLLFILAGTEIYKAATGMNADLIQRAVSQLQFWEVALIFILSICAISPMFLYDVMLVKLLKIQMHARQLVKQSFIANTFSLLIGFGGIAGLMLRSYFYSKYDVNKQVLLKNIASVTIFSVTGISLLAWILPIGYRDIPLLNETRWLYFAVLAVSLLAPLFILYHAVQNTRKNETAISYQVIAKLVTASILEWSALFLVIWYLTHVFHIPIQLVDLIPIFIIATCAGIASMIPGGIGSFDLVFLWGTQSLGIMDEKVLVLLIFYRISYFVVPSLLAALLFIKEY